MRKLAVIGLLAVALLLAGGIAFQKPLRHYFQVVMGNETPDCTELPAAATATGRETELQHLTNTVAQFTGGVGTAEFDTQRCPGKVELHILYASENDKPQLITLWRDSTLHDIPVHWHNI